MEQPREQARLQEVDLEVTYAYILMYVGIHNNSDLLGTSATPYLKYPSFVCLCFLSLVHSILGSSTTYVRVRGVRNCMER